MEKIHTIIDYNHGLAISLALSDFNEIQNIDHEGYSLLLAEDSEFYVVTFFESNLEQGVRGGGGKSVTYKLNKLTLLMEKQEIKFSR